MNNSNKEYNGWTNWHTWNANLWLNNDDSTYHGLLRCENAQAVKILFLEVFDDGSNEYDGIDYGCVNWYEIFEGNRE